VVVAICLYRPLAGILLLGLLPFSGVSITDGVGFLRWATVIVVGAWLLAVVLAEPVRVLRLERLDWWVAAFCALSIASVLVFGSGATLSLYGTYLANLGAYYTISRSISGVREARLAVLALVVGLGAAAAIALLLPGAAAVREGQGGILRVGVVGAAGDPFSGIDRFGGDLLFAVLLPWVALRGSRPATLLARAASAVAFLAFLSTVSRAATIGLVVALVAWALVFPSRSRTARIAVFLAILAGGVAFSPASLRTRFDQLRNRQAEAVSRLAIWRGGARMFWAHPFLGVGVGNYAGQLPRYLRSDQLSRSQQDAHSLFVAALAEMGIVGLAVVLGMVGSLFAESTAWMRAGAATGEPGPPRGPPEGRADGDGARAWRVLAAGLFVTLVGFLVVAATIDLSRDRFLFAVAGLAHAVYRMRWTAAA
jgi:O-Antigen ligase